MAEYALMVAIMGVGVGVSLLLIRPLFYLISTSMVMILSAGVVLLRYNAIAASRCAREFRHAVRNLRREIKRTRYCSRQMRQAQT